MNYLLQLAVIYALKIFDLVSMVFCLVLATISANPEFEIMPLREIFAMRLKVTNMVRGLRPGLACPIRPVRPLPLPPFPHPAGGSH